MFKRLPIRFGRYGVVIGSNNDGCPDCIIMMDVLIALTDCITTSSIDIVGLTM